MQTSLNTVVKNIFNVNSLHELSIQQLEDYINNFPYASVGHLLLAKKKKLESSDYKKVSSIASVYINNPLWLHGFLQDEQTESNEEVHFPQIHSIKGDEYVSGETYSSVSILESQEKTEQVRVEQTAINNEEQENDTHGLLIEPEKISYSVESVKSNTINIDSKEEEFLSIELKENRIPVESVIDEEDTISVIDPTEKIGPKTAPEEEPLKISTDSTMANQEIEIKDEKQIEKEDILAQSPPGNELIFQSYHTVDYFASQGIKLRTGELGNDKLGKQLKSFTEWLRTMKKVAAVPPNDVIPDLVNDASIIKIAEESIETSDVETEAMAEVWIKQGKTGRAKAIYHKLSLLNPSKSHYFASKIEQLND